MVHSNVHCHILIRPKSGQPGRSYGIDWSRTAPSINMLNHLCDIFKHVCRVGGIIASACDYTGELLSLCGRLSSVNSVQIALRPNCMESYQSTISPEFFFSESSLFQKFQFFNLIFYDYSFGGIWEENFKTLL